MKKFIEKLENAFMASVIACVAGLALCGGAFATIGVSPRLAQVVFWIGAALGFAPFATISTIKLLDKIRERREDILDWMLGLNVWASTQGYAAAIALDALVIGVTIILWGMGLLEGFWMIIPAIASGVIICAPMAIEILTDIPLKKAGWIRNG